MNWQEYDRELLAMMGIKPPPVHVRHSASLPAVLAPPTAVDVSHSSKVLYRARRGAGKKT